MYFDEDGDLAHEFYEEVLPRYKNVMLQPRMSVVYRNISQMQYIANEIYRSWVMGRQCIEKPGR